MKKNLFLTAMVGVALTSCVNNEVDDVVQERVQHKITFESPLAYANSSRANVPGEIANPYPQNETFTIYATEYVKGNYNGWTGNRVSGNDDFDGSEVKFDSSVDGWAPKKDGGGYYYWVDGNYMAFAACSPHDLGTGCGTKSYSTDGLTITDFKVQPNSENQYDLLFSKRIYDQDASKMIKVEGQYSGIQLTFQHALSSIHFSIENRTLINEDPNQQIDVTLKDITIDGVYEQGTFKENVTDNNIENGILTYKKNPQWTAHTSIISEAYKAFEHGEAELLFPSVAQYVSKYIKKLENDNSSNAGKYGEAIPLLLLPQTIPSEAKIIVKYQIEGHAEESTKEIKFSEIKDAQGTLLSTVWNIGTKYTYRLVYSDETSKKDRIYFAPTVEGWVDGGIIEVYL